MFARHRSSLDGTSPPVTQRRLSCHGHHARVTTKCTFLCRSPFKIKELRFERAEQYPLIGRLSFSGSSVEPDKRSSTRSIVSDHGGELCYMHFRALTQSSYQTLWPYANFLKTLPACLAWIPFIGAYENKCIQSSPSHYTHDLATSVIAKCVRTTAGSSETSVPSHRQCLLSSLHHAISSPECLHRHSCPSRGVPRKMKSPWKGKMYRSVLY